MTEQKQTTHHQSQVVTVGILSLVLSYVLMMVKYSLLQKHTCPDLHPNDTIHLAKEFVIIFLTLFIVPLVIAFIVNFFRHSTKTEKSGLSNKIIWMIFAISFIACSAIVLTQENIDVDCSRPKLKIQNVTQQKQATQNQLATLKFSGVHDNK